MHILQPNTLLLNTHSAPQEHKTQLDHYGEYSQRKKMEQIISLKTYRIQLFSVFITRMWNDLGKRLSITAVFSSEF